jgi:hypothetical protein
MQAPLLCQPVRYLQIKLKEGDSSKVATGYLQLLHPQKGYILTHQPLAKGDLTLVTILAGLPDTLELRLLPDTYQPYRQLLYRSLWSDADTISLTVLLQKQVDTLPNVEVKAPPTWRRGDTTFFKASAYTAVGDKKLKDIIEKMPGFSIDEQGSLRFQNKLVEKITIEGAEIFADKQQLLLNTFPIHALDQVQALQNQTDEPLLKGLINDNKVFVNLKLKGERPTLIFGDAELTAGTRGRYQVLPTLWAVRGKWKGAYLGNINSMGQFWNEQSRREASAAGEKELMPWQLRLLPIVIDRNLSSARFLRNGLVDQRVQLLWPGQKKGVTHKTEGIIAFDRQGQQTVQQSLFLNDSFLFRRQDVTQRNARPAFYGIRHQVVWKSDSATKWQMHAIINRSIERSSTFETMKVQGATPQLLDNSVHAKGIDIELALTRVHRLTDSRANRQQLVAGYTAGRQLAAGLSETYPSIFQLPAQFVVQQLQQVPVRLNTSLNTEHFFKKRTTTHMVGASVVWEQVAVETKHHFGTADGSQSKPGSIGLPLQQTYARGMAAGFFKTSHRVGKWPLHWQASLGVQHQQQVVDGITRSQFLPISLFSLDARRRFKSQRAGLEIQLSHQQKARPLFQQIASLFPSSISEFRSYAAFGQSNAVSKAELSFNFNSGRLLHLMSLHAERDWQGGALLNRFNNFIQFRLDSFTRHPLNTVGYSYGITRSMPARRLSVNLIIGGNLTEIFFSKGQTLRKGFAQLLWSGLLFQKSWKDVRIDIRNQLLASRVQQSNVSNASTAGWVLNVKSSYLATARLLPWLRAGTNGELVWNRSMIQRGGFFLLADAELAFSPPKKSYSWRLRAENLLNERMLQTGFASATSQSIFQLPLVPQSWLIFFRYEL